MATPLTPYQRASIFMLCKLGVKQKHVAARVGCSVASVKRQWALGKAAVEADSGRTVRVYKKGAVQA